MFSREREHLLRLCFMTRERFHDWMWADGQRPSILRRLARMLPTYLSDPYWVSNERFEELVRKDGLIVTAGSPWITVPLPQTWSSSATTTVMVTNTTWDVS